jgi:hypothetical protein
MTIATPMGSSYCTTPMAAQMMQLLGSGCSHRSVTLGRDEFEAIKKLYGFVPEQPNKKPEPPVAPKREDFDATWKFTDALRNHEQAIQAYANWKDPIAFFQAGADRNALRHAETDGLRLLAYLAKFVPPGEDPLKTLVQFAGAAGVDTNPEDIDWADGCEGDDEEPEDEP